MEREFQTLRIDREHASAAYPLVYLHDGGMTLQNWMGIVRRYTALKTERAGLIAIRDCRGIVHAVYSYRVDRDLRVRKRLCISDLIVAHLPGSQIETAVTASARMMSSELDCQAITIEKPFRLDTEIRTRCPTVEALARKARAHLAAIDTGRKARPH